MKPSIIVDGSSYQSSVVVQVLVLVPQRSHSRPQRSLGSESTAEATRMKPSIIVVGSSYQSKVVVQVLVQVPQRLPLLPELQQPPLSPAPTHWRREAISRSSLCTEQVQT